MPAMPAPGATIEPRSAIEGVWAGIPEVWTPPASIGGNRYELPRLQRSACASVALRHPVLTQGLDDVWNVGMGVAQEFLGLAALPWWSKQWTALIVDAMQQDRQEQAVVHVADVEQWGPGR